MRKAWNSRTVPEKQWKLSYHKTFEKPITEVLFHYMLLLTKVKQFFDLIKACVHYFLSKFYFSPIDSPSKTTKNIHIFVFPSSPLFLPASHCFRGWSKIKLKVYNIIKCLTKKLITHFVWYLGKKKGMTLTLCLLIEY